MNRYANASPKGGSSNLLYCPMCKSDRVTYTVIPPSELHYKRVHEEHVEYLPAMRDCVCRNCDASFFLPIDDSAEKTP